MRVPQYRPSEASLRHVERREWSLSGLAILVTLLLTIGLAAVLLANSAGIAPPSENEAVPVATMIRMLIALVLLIDVYIIYQRYQLYGVQKILRQREELFHLITDNAEDMIAIVGADGKRLYNSPSYSKILGYSPEDLAQTSSMDQIHPDDRDLVMQASEQARESGQGRQITYRMRHKDGRWIFLESTASPIRDANGVVQKIVVVNRDISTRHQLEEQLYQSQKMDAIGRLSGGVAHDFNNLLGLVIGYAEALQDRIPDDDSLRSCVDQILKAGSQGASLTRQLLAFSRQQVMAPKALSLNAIVSDMEKMLKRLLTRDVELITRLAPGLGNVRADQSQMEQIMMNLAVNARDAMPGGGKLYIETANIELGQDFVRGHPYQVIPGPYVRLSVTDTGTGMDAATKKKIFEPFFTTKAKGKGTGLGLATVYGVVKQSGGYIDVESSPGQGATFHIFLPRVNDAVEDKEQGPANVPGAVSAKETILLVEDEHGLRITMRDRLNQLGYWVLDAPDAEAALRISDEFEGTIDLLLTDVVMPGMNGRLLAEEMKRRRPGIQVLFVSGYTGQRMGEDADLASTGHFLQKPFTREDLARKIREILKESDVTPVQAIQ